MIRVVSTSILRRALAIAALSGLSLVSLSVETVGSATPTKEKNSDSRKLVESSVESLVAAWNGKNPDRIARLFLADAVLVLPSGTVTRSRVNIQNRLNSEWQGKLKDSNLSHSIEAISFQGNDAVVKGRYRLEGVSILGFETAPEGPFVLRQRRQQGRWMIAKAEILRNNAL